MIKLGLSWAKLSSSRNWLNFQFYQSICINNVWKRSGPDLVFSNVPVHHQARWLREAANIWLNPEKWKTPEYCTKKNQCNGEEKRSKQLRYCQRKTWGPTSSPVLISTFIQNNFVKSNVFPGNNKHFHTKNCFGWPPD